MPTKVPGEGPVPCDLVDRFGVYILQLPICRTKTQKRSASMPAGGEKTILIRFVDTVEAGDGGIRIFIEKRVTDGHGIVTDVIARGRLISMGEGVRAAVKRLRLSLGLTTKKAEGVTIVGRLSDVLRIING